MRSILAAFRTLTLPAGTTTGERIVLDGTTGEIRIYDAANRLVIMIDGEGGFHAYNTSGQLITQMDETGIRIYQTTGQLLAKLFPDGAFVIFDTAGKERAMLGVPSSGLYSALLLLTGAADETDTGLVSVASLVNTNRMVLTPGERGNMGALELTLMSAAADNSRRALLQVVGLTLNAANPRPYIDLTGASAPAGQEPHTVIYELLHGTPASFTQAPTVKGAIGRGIRDVTQNPSNVTLSTTAGTFSTVVESATIACTFGYWYKASFIFNGNMLVSGSGWATTDTWMMKFQVSVDGGAYADVAPASYIVRSNVAIAMRYMVPDRFSPYQALVTGTLRFRLVASKTSGAATVTTVLEGTSTIFLEEMGYWV